ncbi:hypothetical protein SAMN05518863_104466 [Candidatus Pantoea symbiotica]|jgi:hypothetical protein|uniref:Uncharacterized protein n=1 Tax=Candidatus Pantoea symbiotica TaxID=1884370 RepID=A0A1I3WYH7_9GAMM|nr:hypothetical protein SAMN05518863_104466 [Pantoea symbiotica]SFU76311.1 hypothetical protein SAMN05518864_104466 [Pantoea sp. YR525]
MGLFNIAPAQAGSRFRDDYGAATIANSYITSHCSKLRSSPVAQPIAVVVCGGLNNVA